jgi:cobaltochelatase CobT
MQNQESALLKALSYNAKLNIEITDQLSLSKLHLPPFIALRQEIPHRGFTDIQSAFYRYHNIKAQNDILSTSDKAYHDLLLGMEMARCLCVMMRDLNGTMANIQTIFNHNHTDLPVYWIYALQGLEWLRPDCLGKTDIPLEHQLPISLECLGLLHQNLDHQTEFARILLQYFKTIQHQKQTETQALPKDSDIKDSETTQSTDDSDQAIESEPQDSSDDPNHAPAPSYPENQQAETLTPQDSNNNHDQNGQDDQRHFRLAQEGENPKHFLKIKSAYTIYTTQFDEVITPTDIVDKQELRKLHEILEKETQYLKPIITRLAARLQRRMMAAQNQSWAFEQEEGMLDSARLSQLITHPFSRSIYKTEKKIPFRDTIVCFLIDNSGSMRGKPIQTAALCADILTTTLERCQIETEILGFTTKAWKGGEARKLWLENGQPKNPGRLNALRHIIYKRASMPWRKQRHHLGLMLKEGLLKENIDGEALSWAYNRLNKRPESRKILIVISDGAPIDDATHTHNTPTYLEKDLKSVIYEIEKTRHIELSAIGIGHDVRQYYKNAIRIDHADDLGKAIMDRMDQLFIRR